LKEEIRKVQHLEYSFVWCWNMDTSGSRSEILEIHENVVLQKDGRVPLVRSCKDWKCIAKCQGGEEYLTKNRKKEIWLFTSFVGSVF